MINCEYCGHSLEDNQHGFDQNDGHMEGDKLVHHRRCTYCKVCRLTVNTPEDRAMKTPAETYWEGHLHNPFPTYGRAEQRYRTDHIFRTLVDVLYMQIVDCNYTPTELREACHLAACKYEAMNIRPMIIQQKVDGSRFVIAPSEEPLTHFTILGMPCRASHPHDPAGCPACDANVRKGCEKPSSSQNDLCKCGHNRGAHEPTKYHGKDFDCGSCGCTAFSQRPAPKVCDDCGTMQSDEQREFDQDCRCGGTFVTKLTMRSKAAGFEQEKN